MKTQIFSSSILLSLALVGCAHEATHGTVAMKTSDTIAHISIHNVKAGDSVVLYRNNCMGAGKGEARVCHREKLAEGKVLNVLSEHYSEVQFPTGTKFAEGDFVETVR